jgi:hypothetical protein
LIAALVSAFAVRPAAALQGMASGRVARPGVQVKTDKPPNEVHIEDVAEKAGRSAVNVFGGIDTKKYIVETTGNGAAVFDYDNDGLMDLFLPNGGTLEDRGAGKSHLYRNRGNLKFEDVTGKAGLGGSGWAQGACAGDYVNDGHRDLMVTHWGQSMLYRNNGDMPGRGGRRAAMCRLPGRWRRSCLTGVNC